MRRTAMLLLLFLPTASGGRSTPAIGAGRARDNVGGRRGQNLERAYDVETNPTNIVRLWGV
jgi:hypothetical protein